MAADWQKGYELEELRKLAAPFKQTYKPFHFGAFGLPKERDVATALSLNRLVWTKGPAGEVTAVAIARRLLEEKQIKTLYGVSAVAGRGEIFVEDFAFLDRAAGRKVLDSLLAKSQGLWWRCNMEDSEHRELALSLCGQWAGTAVSAGSELKGWFWIPGKIEPAMTPPNLSFPVEEVVGICCLQKEWADAKLLKELVAEIEAFGPKWGDHYSSYNKRHSWSAIALKGYDVADPSFIVKPDEMSRKWQEENAGLMSRTCEWTEAAKFLPKTLEAVARLPGGDRNRVRIMRLSKDGELSRHADVTNRQAGLRDGMLVRLHVPLQTNPEVKFRSWDALGLLREIHMSAGGLWYLDQRKPHACRNDGGHTRLHLVVDVAADPILRLMIEKKGRTNAVA